MINKTYVGQGEVFLIAGGGKSYVDTALKFVTTEEDVNSIIGSEYNKDLVKRVLRANHKAAFEFDWFLFGVQGYSRVTEVQLVRKRHASYLIKSGKYNKKGRRKYDVVIPKEIENIEIEHNGIKYNSDDILNMLEAWYSKGVDLGIDENYLRYLKPQATEFKGIIGMNATALRDWFNIRCCMNACPEIRDMANKMLKLCKETFPDIFADAGASCVKLGYCPENVFQNKKCKGKVLTHDEVRNIIQEYKKGN